MPVARRIPKVRISPEVDPQTWQVMTDQIDPDELEGWDRLAVVFGDTLPPPNLLTTWRANADQIVAAWAADHPGTRPSCWWRWNAPSERRIVADPEPLQAEDRFVDGREEVGCYLESQASFLERNALLLEGELELLTAADFGPELVTQPRLCWLSPGRYGEPRRRGAMRRVWPPEADSVQA